MMTAAEFYYVDVVILHQDLVSVDIFVPVLLGLNSVNIAAV